MYKMKSTRLCPLTIRAFRMPEEMSWLCLESDQCMCTVCLQFLPELLFCPGHTKTTWQGDTVNWYHRPRSLLHLVQMAISTLNETDWFRLQTVSLIQVTYYTERGNAHVSCRNICFHINISTSTILDSEIRSVIKDENLPTMILTKTFISRIYLFIWNESIPELGIIMSSRSQLESSPKLDVHSTRKPRLIPRLGASPEAVIIAQLHTDHRWMKSLCANHMTQSHTDLLCTPRTTTISEPWQLTNKKNALPAMFIDSIVFR